ncbi:hypothetical protein HY771_01735 [Candidatus Uhrbacteria bacterium]|nr:hypothetical protein [Candidatus Uhrbacteria bacterium]
MQETELKMENQQQKKTAPDAQIFTMPEQYRHGKESKIVEPKGQARPQAVNIPPTPPPPQKPAPILKQPTKKGLSASTKALLISGGIVILALIVTGYILLRSVETQTPTTQELVTQSVVSRPEVEKPIVKEEEEIKEEPAQSVEIVPGKDTDSDGLTDIEEQLIYKTNLNLPDTDADGFLDGNEVFHLYNPSGIAPGTLIEADLVSSFTLPSVVEFVYPSIWQTQTGPTPMSTFIQTTTGESFVIAVRSQTPEAVVQTISDWTQEQGGQEKIVKTTTKTGLEFYIAQNKRAALVMIDSTVLSLTYEIPTKSTADYVQTFQMMINSLKKIVL